MEVYIQTEHNRTGLRIEIVYVNSRIVDAGSVYFRIKTGVTCQSEEIGSGEIQTQRPDELILLETEGVAYSQVVALQVRTILQ